MFSKFSCSSRGWAEVGGGAAADAEEHLWAKGNLPPTRLNFHMVQIKATQVQSIKGFGIWDFGIMIRKLNVKICRVRNSLGKTDSMWMKLFFNLERRIHDSKMKSLNLKDSKRSQVNGSPSSSWKSDGKLSGANSHKKKDGFFFSSEVNSRQTDLWSWGRHRSTALVCWRSQILFHVSDFYIWVNMSLSGRKTEGPSLNTFRSLSLTPQHGQTAGGRQASPYWCARRIFIHLDIYGFSWNPQTREHVPDS